MESLELLYEVADLPQYPLPPDLVRLYGGGLGFPPELLLANFVSSLDGVVALEGEAPSSFLIGLKSEADRFLMGLLRACADAVLIGAGTLRVDHRHLWTPERIYAACGADYAELRRRLGRSRLPELAVLTASGDLPQTAPALEAGALVLTTSAGASRLRGRLPAAATIQVLGDESSSLATSAIAALRSAGHRVILTEGGPHLLGSLLAEGLLRELFLTLSPVLAGRDRDQRRLGLVEGVRLLPEAATRAALLSARRSGSHLFLRYGLTLSLNR